MITFSSYNLLDFSIIWKVVLLRTVPFFSYIFSFFPQCQKFVNGIVTAHNGPNNCWQFLSVTHDFRGKYYSGAKKKKRKKKKKPQESDIQNLLQVWQHCLIILWGHNWQTCFICNADRLCYSKIVMGAVISIKKVVVKWNKWNHWSWSGRALMFKLSILILHWVKASVCLIRLVWD